jgi:hypothetical protein
MFILALAEQKYNLIAVTAAEIITIPISIEFRRVVGHQTGDTSRACNYRESNGEKNAKTMKN